MVPTDWLLELPEARALPTLLRRPKRLAFSASVRKRLSR
jgi:hypothetical protein